MLPKAIRGALKEAESFAEAASILKDHYGSDDKFAQALGPPATRQLTIRWRKGAHPGPEYQEKLAALGVPEELLEQPESFEELKATVRRLEAQIVGIRRRLEAR